jgi:hypothetical protein
MKQGALIDPRMVAGLERSGAFPHTCTVQQRQDTQDSTGAVRPHWATRTGCENVSCRRAISSLGSGGREVRTASIAAIEQNDYIIILAGYYPQITAKDSVLWDDGTTRYDINIANHDSASQLTWLMVRVVQPIADPGV